MYYFWTTVCTHSSGSSNFIYHYSFYHKVSWTTWRREPKRLQWESLPTVRVLLKYKPTRRKRPVSSVLLWVSAVLFPDAGIAKTVQWGCSVPQHQSIPDSSIDLFAVSVQARCTVLSLFKEGRKQLCAPADPHH